MMQAVCVLLLAKFRQVFLDRIIQREYVNSASQKNWAIPQTAHRWVLVVDADERVTPELREIPSANGASHLVSCHRAEELQLVGVPD